MRIDAELARCDREQREILDLAAAGEKPAWLVVLGLEDWEMEKRLIRAGAAAKAARGGPLS